MRMESLERRMLLAIYAPDVSFGQGGHADAAGSSLIQVLSDGSILVANVQTIPDPDDFGGYEAYAHRLNPDGTIDETFGDGGQLYFPDLYYFTWTGSRLLVTGAGSDYVDQLEVFDAHGK